MLLIQHQHSEMVIAGGDLAEMCERFNPHLLGIVSVTDTLIFLAYLSFAVCLAFCWKFIKPHFPNVKWVWFGVCAFVSACGTQHILRTIGLWEAGYWWYIEAYWSIWVAIVSIFTATIVFQTYRKIKSLKSLRLAMAITADVLTPKSIQAQLEDSRRLQAMVDQMRQRVE